MPPHSHTQGASARQAKIAVQCPRCGAPAGSQCIGTRGQERAAIHSCRIAKRRPWGNPGVAWEKREADDLAEAVRREGLVVSKVEALAKAIGQIDDLSMVWGWGDGDGGYILELIRRAYGVASPTMHRAPMQRYAKARIGRALSKAVMERDGYRCVTCSTHFDLTCDHVIPESKGGPTTFENLQTMCAPCNSRKGVK